MFLLELLSSSLTSYIKQPLNNPRVSTSVEKQGSFFRLPELHLIGFILGLTFLSVVLELSSLCLRGVSGLDDFVSKGPIVCLVKFSSKVIFKLLLGEDNEKANRAH